MKLIRKTRRFECLFLALGALFLATSAEASPGDFYTSTEARVVGHLSLPENPARQMFVQQVGRKPYLYVRQASQSGFTVVDVTKPKKPRIVNHVSQENLILLNSGLALSETRDKSTHASPSHSMEDQHTGLGASNAPESVRVLNIAIQFIRVRLRPSMASRVWCVMMHAACFMWRMATASGSSRTNKCCGGISVTRQMQSRRRSRIAIS
jgi:hypothetical protein